MFRVCVCSLSYPACKAHVPHTVICGLSGYTALYSGKITEHKNVCFDFLYNFRLFVSDFHEMRIFSTDFWQRFKYQIP
jgi:hypothetical protein